MRKTAMAHGVVELIIDRLLDIDSSISKDLHVHSRNALRKKMTEPLKTCFELMMNLMFSNPEAKKLAASKGLASVLISVWITLVYETESLHILFLRLLCTFGANCQESLSSFVKGMVYFSAHCPFSDGYRSFFFQNRIIITRCR